MTETFRLRKKVKYQGMALTAFFLAAVVGSSCLFFLEEPAKHGFKRKHSVAVVGGLSVAVYGTMMLGSVYIWAAYYVERFTIDGTMLSIRTMLQNRQFDVSELEFLKWKVYPAGGSIRFRVLGSKARLDLHGYSRTDRLGIIRALYEVVPPQVQDGWPLFCHKVALPLRDGKPSIARTDPVAKFHTITRKRYDRMLAIGLPLSVAAAIVCWMWMGLWQFIALPITLIAAWLFVRFSVPPEGRTITRITSTSEGRAQLVGLGAVGIAYALMVGLRLWGVPRETACWIAIAVMIVALAPMFNLLRKSEKQRRTAEKNGAELAPQVWLDGERRT